MDKSQEAWQVSPDDRTVDDVSQPTPRAQEKRAVKRPRKPREQLVVPAPSKTENRYSLWTEEHLTKLVDHLQKNGFYGDYQELATTLFPNVTDCTVKNFVMHLSRWGVEDPNQWTEKGLVLSNNMWFL